MTEQRLQNPYANSTDYGDEDIPVGPRLSAYLLHTDEWRRAFLERLTQVGYIGLIEASEHVYALLTEPVDFRCALVAQLANVSGSGKLAIYNSLKSFLDDFLEMPSLPASGRSEGLDHYHARVTDLWEQEAEREQQLIRSFSSILNGEPPMAPPVARSAEVFAGPWGFAAEVTSRESHAGDVGIQPRLRPSMADPSFVESRLMRMLASARAIPKWPHHKENLAALIDNWSAEFSPENTAYSQTFCSEGLSIFLRLRGYGRGTPPDDFSAPIKDLIKETLSRCLDADRAFSEGNIYADMHTFSIEAAIEDCQCFLRGYDNPAD